MNNRKAQQALREARYRQAAQNQRRSVSLPKPVLAEATTLTPTESGAVAKEKVVDDHRHPLADLHTNARLAFCEEKVNGRFDAIIPALQAIAGLHLGAEFTQQAQQLAEVQLGYRLPESILDDAWVSGVDMKALYAYCTFRALELAAEQFANDLRQQVEAVQDTRNFFLDCGFHVVDISPCADGRLKGLLRYILRLPLTSLIRWKAYAGALFDVETDVAHWAETELRRFREGVPTTVDSGSRYLKIAVYHISSGSPCDQGCAAHGSNDHQALAAALDRLNQFRQAIENSFCCGASTDILLIGVDTDTDAIRVHIPDGKGELSPQRFVDNTVLYHDTLDLSADAARLAVHEAIDRAIRQQGWGTGQGEPHDGMRRLVTHLLINNLSQMAYVKELHNGKYEDIGHAEYFISVGDGFEEVQIRNVAYYAHLQTLEEGVADMDVGIKIFKSLNIQHGLPAPVAIHYRYDARVPGSRERTVAKAKRVAAAIRERYATLVKQGLLVCHLSVQDIHKASPMEVVEDVA